MKLSVTLITILTISFAPVFSQTNLPEIVKAIKETNQAIPRHGGPKIPKHGGPKIIAFYQSSNFEKLKNIAKTNELIELTEHKKGKVQCYAAWALSDLKYPNFEQVFEKIINHDKEIAVLFGCIRNPSLTSIEVYSRIQSAKSYSPNWSSDSLYYQNILSKIDSLILYHKKSNNFLLYHASINKAPNEKYYQQIRKIALKKKDSGALIALAKFQKQADILPIIKFGEGNFAAIAQFPNEQSWVYLMQSYPKLEEDRWVTKDFLHAIAAFKNKKALKILSDIIHYADNKKIDWLLQKIQVAILTNKTEIYESLLIELWEKYSIIDKVTFHYLKNQKTERSRTIIENGLLNNNRKHLLSDYLSHNYHAEYLVADILSFLEATNSNQLIAIINQNIIASHFMDLSYFTKLIIKLQPASSAEIILEQITKKQAAYELFQLSKVIFSYQNTDYNKRLVKNLKTNSNWELGDWSDSFRKLFLENGMKLD